MHSFSNLKYVGIFDCIEDKVFMIKRNQTIYTRIVIFKDVYNKKCNRDGKLHDASESSFSLYSSISTTFMPDKTQKFCYLSLHSCNNGI